MVDTALGILTVLAIVALWDLDQIRKDMAQMRMMMEKDGADWRQACKSIAAIGRMLETEITDRRERRMRELLRDVEDDDRL